MYPDVLGLWPAGPVSARGHARPPATDLPIEAALPGSSMALAARSVGGARGPARRRQDHAGADCTSASAVARRRRVADAGATPPSRPRGRAHGWPSCSARRSGETVGYAHAHSNRRIGRDTRIEVVTEGVLTREPAARPGTRSVRRGDVRRIPRALASTPIWAWPCAWRRRNRCGPTCSLLVMSATLDGARARPASRRGAGGRAARAGMFPVEVAHLGRRPAPTSIELRTRRAVDARPGRSIRQHAGVPARRGRDPARGGAARELGADVQVYPLYGELARAEQDAALARRVPGRRKIVLATNIAETSLTIEGVRGGDRRGLRAALPVLAAHGHEPAGHRADQPRLGRAAARARRPARAGPVPIACGQRWRIDPGRRSARPRSRRPIWRGWRWSWLPGVRVTRLPWPCRSSRPRGRSPRRGHCCASWVPSTTRAPSPRMAAPWPTCRCTRVSPIWCCALAEHGMTGTAIAVAALLSGRDPDRDRTDVDLARRLDLMPPGSEGQRVRAQLGRLLGAKAGPVRAEEVGAVTGLAFPDRLAQARPGSRGAYRLANGRGAVLDGSDPLAARALAGRGRGRGCRGRGAHPPGVIAGAGADRGAAR